ncbi:hypothetical protein F5I97DRAFT_72880 [Phlebopus sp. FC_14]|nr:hypothetical protein F5I97DRAFT_72880 [Phlebopus sp. FC_14]
MSVDLVKIAWAPGIVGFAISATMYGVTVGQSFYYARFFPADRRVIKSMVLLIFIMDTIHFLGFIQFYWAVLVSCHQSYSHTCETELPWGAYFCVSLNVSILRELQASSSMRISQYAITCAVQSFYCHRIWIISGANKHITVTILFTVILQLCLGSLCSIRTIQAQTIEFIFTTPLTAYAAGVSTICDAIITGAIIKYLCLRERFRRQPSLIQELTTVLVNAGVLTCLVSLSMGVVYVAQGGKYWTSAPAAILSRSYVNSFLAVERPKIYKRQGDRAFSTWHRNAYSNHHIVRA